jgi:hypothetical protein
LTFDLGITSFTHPVISHSNKFVVHGLFVQSFTMDDDGVVVAHCGPRGGSVM